MADGSSGGGGGSNYGQVIGDGQQTVTLAGALVDLVGRPLSSLWSKQNAVAGYRAKLGEWADEAIDSSGRWLQPVLRTAAFEDHLVQEGGHFKPKGKCESPFAWAQLLYTLNIRPKAGILAWRLPPKAIDPSEKSDVALVVDGIVMCHIINLYRIYSEAAPRKFSPEPSIQKPTSPYDIQEAAARACWFPFGRLALERLGTGSFAARFEPGAQSDLAAERVPFVCHHRAAKCTHLRFEQDSLIAKYFSAVLDQVPIADTVNMGRLPPPDASLEIRVDYYQRSIQMLCSRDWGRPRVVTRPWLFEIARIKRRVTTNGGQDDGLLQYIVNALESRPHLVGMTEKQLRDGHLDQDDTAMVHQLLMFSRDRIHIEWTQRFRSRGTGSLLSSKIIENLPQIFAEPASEHQARWLVQLAKMLPALQLVLESPDEFLNVPVVVLELGPDHDMWNNTWEVNGE